MDCCFGTDNTTDSEGFKWLIKMPLYPGVVEKLKMIEPERLWPLSIIGNPRFVIRTLKQWGRASHIQKRMVSGGQPG